LTYRYDVFGNLFEHLLNGSTSEYFVYDKLHRIESATRSGGASGVINYTYGAVGNFRSKSDFSSTAPSAYSYVGGSCGGGPNAVKSVALAGGGSRTYCYDANGNLRTDTGGFSARYDHDNLPIELARGLENTRLMYGADGEKIRQSTLDNARRHVYVDGTFEQVFTQSRGNEWKTYFGDFAVVTRTPSGSRTVEYLLKDRLGSVDSVANSQGFLVDTRAHDPFGKPRQGNWADIPGAPRFSAASMGITPRGFTQHEHLNSVEIIHMNGRAFDYSLGRFLSVDPIIQFPTNSQSLNPYSYLQNNPLWGTDPTGYFGCAASRIKSSCDKAGMGSLMDGVNRAYDAAGNQIATIIVGNTGDTLEFKGSSGELIGRIGSGENGASLFGALKNDPSSIGSIARRIEGNFEAIVATAGIGDASPALVRWLPGSLPPGSQSMPGATFASMSQGRLMLGDSFAAYFAWNAMDLLLGGDSDSAGSGRAEGFNFVPGASQVKAGAVGFVAASAAVVQTMRRPYSKKISELVLDGDHGRIHGVLPSMEEFLADISRMSAPQLRELVETLRSSVAKRLDNERALGFDPGHAYRKTEELRLLSSLLRIASSATNLAPY